jgi:hypothetical protein
MFRNNVRRVRARSCGPVARCAATPRPAFTARLRHTIDLDALRHDLVDVTHEAFQPAHISMWIAPADDQDRPW